MKPKQKVYCGNKFYFHVVNQNRKYCTRWAKTENNYPIQSIILKKKSFWKVQTNKNMQLPDTLRMGRYDMLRCLQKFAIKVSLVQIKTHA